MRWVWLGLLLGVQPWLRWPGFVPDASHRLTLAVCGIGLALWRVQCVNQVALPTIWGTCVAVTLGTMAWHLAPAVTDAAYLGQVHEVAFLSSGVLTVVTAAFVVWAVAQVPVTSLRRLRWAGLALCVVQLAGALIQWASGAFERSQGVPGGLGTGRMLGTYAVAWLPILLCWRPRLAVVSAALVLMTLKPLIVVGAVVASWRFLSQTWRRVAVVVGLGTFLATPLLAEKLGQRATTWWHGLAASLAHPVVGWGFHPMASANVRTYGEMLPSFHNDWLTLAVYGGWVVAGLAFWCWWRLVRSQPRTCWAAACQASLLSLGCLAAVQDTVSQARIGGLALVLLAWWLVEQRSSDEESPGGDPAVGAVQ